MAIFPNVCLGRRIYAQNWEVLTLKNCYGFEPPSYVSTAYVVASYGPRILSTVRFVKIWATCENFVWQMVYHPPPPGKKISRTPMHTHTSSEHFQLERRRNHAHPGQRNFSDVLTTEPEGREFDSRTGHENFLCPGRA